MKLKEASEFFGIPANVIKKMGKERVIGLPLDEDDLNRLSFLSQLWGRSWFAAATLKGVRARDRAQLLLFPDYNKIDRYVLNTILNASDMNQPAEVLKYRVKMAFAADVETQRIRRLKRVAADIRARKKKLVVGKLSLDYADILGIRTGRNG